MLIGCAKKKDKSHTNSNTQVQVGVSGISEVEVVSVKDMFALWDAGHKDDAIKKFLSIKWDDSSVYREIPVLTMLDRDWRSLQQGEQVRIVQDALKQTQRLSHMVKEVISKAKILASSGDEEVARKYFKAVRDCGEALSQRKLLENIRDFGKVTTEYAQEQEKLSGIK